MCFRPPTVNKPIKCPSCETLNPANLKLCKKCQGPLEAEEKKGSKDGEK